MEDLRLKKGWFIQGGTGNIEDNYDFDEKKELGQGTYGRVVKGTHKITKAIRAIKIIPKAKVKNHERFATEINILKTLDHPNIIKLYETYEDTRNVYLIFEICEGGELFDRIIDKGFFSEEEARNLFSQIMRSIHYCHIHGICHRDLKPENFLFATKAKDSPLKIIDFGLSKIYKPEEELLAENEKKTAINMGQFRGRKKVVMNTKAGTVCEPYYIAPEVLSGNYNEKCDIWSAGVMLYILLCGYPPFYGQTDPQILEAVKKGKYDFSGAEWKNVSESARDLIKKMLVPHETRLDSEAVLKHPWMQAANKGDAQLNVSFDKLKNFIKNSKFKQASLQYLASQMDERDIDNLIKEFNKLDADGDGEIGISEFKDAIVKLNRKSTEEIENVFKQIDSDCNGRINYTEFIAATMNQSIYLKEEKLYQAFKMFDKNNDGFISADEIKGVLGNDPKYKDQDNEVWVKMIQEADTNGDGLIDYNEFIKLMGAM